MTGENKRDTENKSLLFTETFFNTLIISILIMCDASYGSLVVEIGVASLFKTSFWSGGGGKRL